jgi:hypothetical protein
VVYSPFNAHVIEFWKLAKENSNILFIFYEDMKRDLESEVKKVMKFLNKNFSQEQIEKLCLHLSFDSMKKNPACNYEPNILSAEIKNQSEEKFEFIREGKIGSHLREMTNDEIKSFDMFMNDPELKNFGFVYKT